MPGQKFLNAVDGRLGDTLQHTAQMSLEIYFVEFGGTKGTVTLCILSCLFIPRSRSPWFCSMLLSFRQ